MKGNLRMLKGIAKGGHGCPHKTKSCGSVINGGDDGVNYLLSCPNCTNEVSWMLKVLKMYMDRFGDIKTVFGKRAQTEQKIPEETL